jgi:hypothetical protein
LLSQDFQPQIDNILEAVDEIQKWFSLFTKQSNREFICDESIVTLLKKF